MHQADYTEGNRKRAYDRRVASRYATDRYGRLLVEITSPTCVELPVGMRFLVRGTTFAASGTASGGWAGPVGRRPRRNGGDRTPYRAPTYQPTPEPPDDELDEQAAIAAAYAEQRQQPADVVNVAL